MKRGIVAVSVVLMLGVSPAVADDTAAPPDPQWARPAATVVTDPATLVADSGDSGAMTVVYAVQDGQSLRIETTTVPDAVSAEGAISQIQEQPDVVAVDVDSARRLTGLPTTAIASDPARADQWALDTLQAETAWDSSVGDGVTVAVIDSGVSQHPDLAGRFVKGVDFVDGTNARVDYNGHGTHVAGIIAMTSNNGQGGAGLAPGVAIMPVVVADASGWVRAADSAKGIVWAVDHGADVLNMSYSGSASSVEQKAIQYALSKGVVPVAAVGNAYLDSGGTLYNPIQYPAAFPGVIGVGAVTRGLKRSSFSEVGKQVDVVAPGGSGLFDSDRGIFSTYSDSRYVRMPGTSMAAPYAAATLALALSRERALGLDVNAEDAVLSTATDLGTTGRDDEFGFGLINPVAALSLMTNIASNGTPAPVIEPSEVQTRITNPIRVKASPGVLRYKIPASGRFVVAIQRITKQKWSKPVKFARLRKGRTWHSVEVPAGLRVRIVAVRSNALDKADPLWVSPTTRTQRTR